MSINQMQSSIELDNQKLGHVVRPDPNGKGFWLMHSFDPSRRWGTHGVHYPSLEALCDANNLALGAHYDYCCGEYWRALPKK